MGVEGDALSRCHPAVALAFFAAAIALMATVQHPAYLAAGILAAAGYLVLLRGRAACPFLAGLIPLFLLVAAINPLFNTRGSHVLAEFLGRPYTLEALLNGAAVGAMLAGMLVWFACYGAVVTADKLTCLFGNLAPSVSLLAVMALRMVPDLMRKAARIASARRCVGLSPGALEGAGLRERVRDGSAVLGALVDHALEGSVCTADSMCARGYGTARRRTTFLPYRWGPRDMVLAVCMAGFLIGLLACGIPGAAYTPRLSIEPVSWGFAAYLLFLFIPFALRAKEALQWRRSYSSM